MTPAHGDDGWACGSQRALEVMAVQGDAGAMFLEVCGLGIATSVSASPLPAEEPCQGGQQWEGAGVGSAVTGASS